MLAARGVFWLLAWYVASLVNMFATKQFTQGLEESSDTFADLIVYSAYAIIGNAIVSVFTSRFCRSKPPASVDTGNSNASAVVTAAPTMSTAIMLKMLIAGCLRGITHITGTCTLFYSPVSLVEAVKSTAPIFTMALAYFLRGESSKLTVILRSVQHTQKKSEEK